MSFKAIATPRKLSTIDGEVRSGAYLSNPGTVAMVTRAPVRVATFSSNGTVGKVTNVSLDGAESLALLSADTALVRGSDDSVWAVQDLLHTPRLGQVARDARALAFRPGGETALVLGWDQSGTELRLAKQHVEARPFVLRGSVRAIDVGETETYTIVDGPGGGQVHVHPGATPEPAASLRADLPKEAASLDHVRGCPTLVAVFKPGNRSVCVLTGGPVRLVAKLVQLEAAPTAVSVIETSMIATFADGHAVLYNAERISAATAGGALTSPVTVKIGGHGVPTALMTVGRGGAAAWFGTAGGDVLYAPLVRTTAA